MVFVSETQTVLSWPGRKPGQMRSTIQHWELPRPIRYRHDTSHLSQVKYGLEKVQFVIWILLPPYLLADEANTRVPAAHEVQSHRSQQQNLLWERHTPDVCGLCRELYQGLCSHGHCSWGGLGPGLARKVAEPTGPPKGGGLSAGGHEPGHRLADWFSLWSREALLTRARISQTSH